MASTSTVPREPQLISAPEPEALLERFGLSSFRPGQREAVVAALEGRDSLVRDAHRWGEVAVLPAPGARRGRTGARRKPSDRAHVGPVASGAGRRGPGVHAGVGDGRGTQRAQPGGDPLRRRPARAGGAGAVLLGGLPVRGGGHQGEPVRGRRGPLRGRVGPRFPPRLPAPSRRHRVARPSSGDGPHRHRDPSGGGGDTAAARTASTRCPCAPASTARTSPSTSWGWRGRERSRASGRP